MVSSPLFSVQSQRSKEVQRMKNNRAILVLSAAALLAMDATANARTLICESNEGRSQYCRADTRGGVRLVRKFSKAGCYEGSSWGYDQKGIWVTNGCRAQFEVMDAYRERYDDRRYPQDDRRDWQDDHYRPERHVKQITCESWDGRQAYCSVRVRDGQVNIVRQLSKQRCRYGQNWGWNGGGIWVTDGCRAVFEVY